MARRDRKFTEAHPSRGRLLNAKWLNYTSTTLQMRLEGDARCLSASIFVSADRVRLRLQVNSPAGEKGREESSRRGRRGEKGGKERMGGNLAKNREIGAF